MRRAKRKPTRDEIRAAVEYTRAQFRIMWPKHKSQRRPEYRNVVTKVLAQLLQVKP